MSGKDNIRDNQYVWYFPRIIFNLHMLVIMLMPEGLKSFATVNENRKLELTFSPKLKSKENDVEQCTDLLITLGQ